MFTEEAERLSRYILAEDSEIEFRIRSGTEMYRKGFGHFVLKDAEGGEVAGATIRLKQKTHEYKFGCNAFMIDSFPEKEQNERYEKVFGSLFNLAVVPFYWSDLEPEQGKTRFTKESPFLYRRPAPDRVLEFCEKYGIMPKGHPLCWHNFWPGWVPNNTKDVMRLLEKRFEEISERYRDKIPVWDAVNEAQTLHPSCRKNAPPLPPDYVEQVFHLADRFFPDNRKLYNDDSTWWNFQGDYTPVYLLVRHLLERGCKVGGLGLQYHMFGNMTGDNCIGVNRPLNPRCILQCLDQYQKLGIPVNFSEVSVISRRDLGDGDRFQELVAEKLYRLWFSHPATEAIVWWNMVDGTAAYAPLGSEEGENSLRAGLVNYDFTPKPAFRALERLIKREWHTETVLEYRAGADNRFHGFYGKYDAEIETEHGRECREFDLSRFSGNEFNFMIK